MADDKIENHWQTILAREEEVANIKLRVVKAILANPETDEHTIARLFRDVEEKARHFDRLFLEMSEELDHKNPLINVALVIEGTWSKMSVELAARLKAGKQMVSRMLSADF
jgi:hypothetical protein